MKGGNVLRENEIGVHHSRIWDEEEVWQGQVGELE